MKSKVSWNPHVRKIVLYCLLVTTPMLVSSFALLWIVYANLTESACPSAELCPGSNLINATSKDHYFVDIPAARLAFLSSWSSTISFALVGFLMTLSAYTTAAELLRASKEGDQGELPSPHQMSTLLAILNAEMIMLWTLAVAKLRRSFWNRAKDADDVHHTPRILRVSILILLIGIVSSILVQAADAYFHIAIQSVNLVQIEEALPASHALSRGIAPWCTGRPNMGPLGPKSLWGCGITATAAPANSGTTLAPTNATTIQDLKNSVSDLHTVLNFTDANNVQFAVIGPANVDLGMDWKATSFAVSTTCTAIPDNGCDVADPLTSVTDGTGTPLMLVPFNCTADRANASISGNLTSHNTKVHTLDFHKYAKESAPFFNNTMETISDAAIESIKAGESGDSMFRNPWGALVMRKIPFAIQGDFSELPAVFMNDSRIWKSNSLGALALMMCNITVWDITYTSHGPAISFLLKSSSNGSTAGIASMPGIRAIGTLTNIFQDESTGPFARSSPQHFIDSFALGMSKTYAYALASQTTSTPALLVQQRTSRIVTQVPVSALWLLVVSNLLFAALGVALAVLAVRNADDEVHQVQLRLGVAGLVAALFDGEQFERSAVHDEKLFEENLKGSMMVVKRIGVQQTDSGGSAFAVFH